MIADRNNTTLLKVIGTGGMKKRNKKKLKLMNDVIKKYIDSPLMEMRVAKRNKKYINERGRMT